MRRLLGFLSTLMLIFIFSQTAQAQTVYTVQPGDNLFRISLRFNVQLGALAAQNNILNPNLIFVGQQLVIPGTGTPPPPAATPDPSPPPADGDTVIYTVRRGDTLASIARRFGTTFTAIAARNNIANPNLIFAGQQLVISGTVPAPGVPPPSGPPPAGGFELGGHVLRDYPFADLMRNTGMTWAKRQIRWSLGTPASALQGEIDAAQSRGFKVLLSIVGERDQLAANPTQYYQDFANFLGGVAALGADAIEVWNEPNIEREWPNGQVNGANYTQMLSAAFQAIKAQNPNTLVISAAPAPTGFFGGTCQAAGCDDNIFIQQMRNAGATNFMDCVGIHYNAGAVPPSATSGAPVGSPGHYSWYYPSMVNLYRGVFPGKPLCFTEIGYLSGDGFSQPLPPAFSWAAGTSVAEHAQWLADAAVRARNSGAVRLFIIWNVDSNTFGDDPQAGYAIVRPDNTCPACNTLSASL